MTLTLTDDLDLQSPASYGHELYSHTKVQRQRSVGFEDKEETNGRTDASALPSTLMRSVKMTDRHQTTAYTALA